MASDSVSYCESKKLKPTTFNAIESAFESVSFTMLSCIFRVALAPLKMNATIISFALAFQHGKMPMIASPKL